MLNWIDSKRQKPFGEVSACCQERERGNAGQCANQTVLGPWGQGFQQGWSFAVFTAWFCVNDLRTEYAEAFWPDFFLFWGEGVLQKDRQLQSQPSGPDGWGPVVFPVGICVNDLIIEHAFWIDLSLLPTGSRKYFHGPKKADIEGGPRSTHSRSLMMWFNRGWQCKHFPSMH